MAHINWSNDFHDIPWISRKMSIYRHYSLFIVRRQCSILWSNALSIDANIAIVFKVSLSHCKFKCSTFNATNSCLSMSCERSSYHLALPIHHKRFGTQVDRSGLDEPSFRSWWRYTPCPCWQLPRNERRSKNGSLTFAIQALIRLSFCTEDWCKCWCSVLQVRCSTIKSHKSCMDQYIDGANGRSR